ncbi:unnamed protein product, partial [Iphiclides podalirius]
MHMSVHGQVHVHGMGLTGLARVGEQDRSWGLSAVRRHKGSCTDTAHEQTLGGHARARARVAYRDANGCGVSGRDLRLAVEPESDRVRPNSPLTARSERRMSSGSRRTHDERRRSLRREPVGTPPSAPSAHVRMSVDHGRHCPTAPVGNKAPARRAATTLHGARE